MTSPEQSLVVGRMHPRDRREDADQLALLAGTTREEVESRRRGRLVHSAERKTRDFTVGSRGGVRIPIRRVKGGYKWGSKGKVYRNRKDAERQAAAAYASGYKKSMSWFNVLKLSGKELTNHVPFADEKFYRDITPKDKLGYTVRNLTITRPHFEGKSRNVGALDKDDLQVVRTMIGAKGQDKQLNFSFASPDNEDYLVSWRRVTDMRRELPGSGILEGRNRQTGRGLGHTSPSNGIIVFDSVYPTDIDKFKGAIDRIKHVMKKNKVQRITNLWIGDDDRWKKVLGKKETAPTVTWSDDDEEYLKKLKDKNKKHREKKRKFGNQYRGDGRYQFREEEIKRLEERKTKALGTGKKKIGRTSDQPPNPFKRDDLDDN